MDSLVNNFDSRCRVADKKSVPCRSACPASDAIAFQVLDCHSRDICDLDAQHIYDDFGNDIGYYKTFTMHLFGLTRLGISVCATVTGHLPSFSVKMPPGVSVQSFRDALGRRKFSHGTAPKQWNTLDDVIVGVRPLMSQELCGFTNEKLFQFAEITFRSEEGMKKCDYVLQKHLSIYGTPHLFRRYESNLSPLLRFFHDIKSPPGGWIGVGKQFCTPSSYSRTCQTEFITAKSHITPVDILANAPFRQFSFDIEVYSTDGSFPQPEVDDNVVIQIATTIEDYGGGGDCAHSHIINLGPCDPIDGVELVCCETEAEVILAWTDLVVRLDPDIILGYNINGFDFNYLYVRAKKAGVFEKFSQMGRLDDTCSTIVFSSMSSAAYGHNDYRMFPMIGRLHLDVMTIIKREEKYNSYTLNHVAEKILGDKKHDVSPAEMFEIFRQRDPARTKVLAEYCIKDTSLPQRIMNKRNTLSNLIEMAKVTYVPLRYLVERGQQIKVFSLLTKMARDSGILVPVYVKPTEVLGDENDDGYEGATVLDAQVGAYFKHPIAVDDFASLYPGIMMDHNLCYSSLITDERYAGMEGVDYITLTVAGKQVMFAQTKVALLPRIMRHLLQSRKLAKGEMARATNKVEYDIANGKQLAYKVTCNSVYGFTGCVKNGMLPCKEIASAVTMIGREMIDDSKRIAEDVSLFPEIEGYNARVVYGDTDSIFVMNEMPDHLTPAEKINRSMSINKLVGKRITEYLRSKLIYRTEEEMWVDLEFEKVYHPLLLFNKKRYLGPLHMESKGDSEVAEFKYVDAKGIVLTRRDNCSLLKNVYTACSNHLLDNDVPVETRVASAIEALKTHSRALFDGKVCADDLAVSKSLRNEYKVRTKDKFTKVWTERTLTMAEIVDPNTTEAQLNGLSHCHVRLARKMALRDPGTAPKSGSRVFYVFVVSSRKRKRDTMQWEVTEHLDYVKEKDLEIDYLYYFDRQLTKPLTALFELVTPAAGRIIAELRNEFVRKSERQPSIMQFFK